MVYPQENRSLCRQRSQKFTNNHLLAKQCIKNKHNPLQLELALKECFGEKTLADSLNRIIIPSYNIGEDDIYLFKTPHNQRLSRDYKVPVWKVAMATSAAPTYLPTFKGFDHVRLVDGGIWANNPVMVAISEAISMLDVKMNDIYVMSIGTTYGVKGRSSKLDNGGFLQWRKDAVEVIMRAQSIGTLTQAQHLLGKEHISRLDPKVPDGLFALDKLSEKELLAKASHESLHFTPVFQETFCNHKAEEFIPLYTMEGEN